MALTPDINHALYAQIFSRDTIRQREGFGELNADDVAFIFQLQADLAMSTDELLGIVGDVNESLIGTISDEIDSGFGEFGGALDAIEGKVKDWIRDALGPIFEAIQALSSRVSASIAGSLSNVIEVVAGISSTVQGGIDDVLDQARSLADTITQNILNPVLNTLANAITLISRIVSDVKDVVNESLAPIIATTGTILDSVQGFATALRDVIPAFGTQLLDGLADPVGLLTDGIKDAAGSILSAFFGDIAEDAVERIEPLIKMFEDELSVNPELRKITAPGLLPVAAVGGLIAGFALPMILSSVASTALSPFAEKMRQKMNSLVRPALMGVTDAIQGQQRGFMTQALSTTISDRHGFPDDQVGALVQLIKTRPGTMDIIDYWRREIFSDTEATTELRNLGWDERYIGILKEAAFPPPGVSDLIRMAVREVFSPEVAEAFGQFEEIPDQYLVWAKRVGLSDEWARNFWAAHWVLPSVQQGFQMLHRSVITEDDLERLFVALDVMPFWRQPLKDISFRPFTRVDVRRMFALGVLDRAGVLRSYLDLGFSPDKAENMTEFTVKWVESTRKIEKDRERDLTKSDILGLFNDGLLDEDEAISHLRSMGYDDNESDLLIGREILQEILRDRKADIALIVDQAKIKVLTFSEAQDALSGLDLTTKELSKAMIDVSRATTERVLLPSKGDLDGWKELNLISLPEYKIELDNLGFPAKYVALYVLESEIEPEPKTPRDPRLASKGQLDSLLRDVIITPQQYREGLIALRFTTDVISDFSEQIILQLEQTRIDEELKLAELLLAEEERTAREAEPRPITKGQLDSLLRTEVIETEQYINGLDILGFDDIAISNFVIQITLEIEERRLENEARQARGEEAAEKEKPLGRVLLGKLLLKEIIDFDAYETGLQVLGFSVESVSLLVRLMREKVETALEKEAE